MFCAASDKPDRQRSKTGSFSLTTSTKVIFETDYHTEIRRQLAGTLYLSF
jgi:hypothetical protein